MEAEENTLSLETTDDATNEPINNNANDDTSDQISTNSQANPYKRITRRIDSVKIRNNQKRDVEVNVSFTNELNIVKDTPVRAGAIIYTIADDKTYFCLGIDTQSGNLTDFGGGVKKGETIIEGGLRELEEESQGVFGHFDPSDIEDTVTFNSYNMAVIFIPLEVNKDEIIKVFNDKIRENDNPEVCDIVWLDTEEFLESVHGRGRKLYIRVRKLLSKVTSTIREL